MLLYPFAMRQLAGYVLSFGGAMLAVGAYVFRFPAHITVNGHTADVFSVLAAAGLVLMALGIALVRRAA